MSLNSGSSQSDDLRKASSHHSFAPPPPEVRVTDLQLISPSGDSRATMYNQYLRGPQVGTGQHGSVYQCWDTRTGREVAIKVVKRNNPRAEKLSLLRQNQRQSHSGSLHLRDKLGSAEYKIRKEIAIMKKCRHPHVVQLLEVIDDKQNERILMVMEYLGGGEIKWRTSSGEPMLQVNQSRRICRDVILGLEYLHYQGIIHRDIKPANLLWTSDRRAVKITDFGVSHFSYAQRLAAAGRSRAEQDDPNDPILLDDSDLSKTAGTPTFLAPEVIAEPSLPAPHESSDSSSTIQASVFRKPPITKAIDVWSLGVTLYCLLFGHIPFSPPEDDNSSAIHSEYMLYETIRTQDWAPDETMGLDHIPTGGRHPEERNIEGAIVMEILDRMLTKDAPQRIELDDLKRHPWFLRDIVEPERWLEETSPRNNDVVVVSDTETSSAMSPLRFSWGWNKDRIKSLLRTVKPRRSLRSTRSSRNSIEEKEEVSPTSQNTVGRHKSTVGRVREGWKAEKGRADKGKGRASPVRPSTSSGPFQSLASASASPGRSQSFERWPVGKKEGDSTPPASAGPSVRVRRGSETLLIPPRKRSLHFVPQEQSPTSSQLTGETTFAEASSQYQLDERVRSRFSFLKPSHWLSRSPPQQPTSAASTCSSPGARHISASSSLYGGATPKTRKSEEGLQRHRNLSRRSESSGRLTAARRASSWGDPVDYTADATSLHGGERIDDETMNVGAGGVYTDVLPLVLGIPPSLGSVAQASGSIVPSASIPAAERHYVGNAITQYVDSTVHEAMKQLSIRSSTASPLTQELFDPPVKTEIREASDDEESSLGDFQSMHSQEHSEERPRTIVSGTYTDEDEDKDEEDQFIRPLEFRRKPAMSTQAIFPPSSPSVSE